MVPISGNAQEVADLDASRKEATKMRTEEKAANKAAVEDSQAAQKAVAAATAVLQLHCMSNTAVFYNANFGLKLPPASLPISCL